jgi:hypothetical protein
MTMRSGNHVKARLTSLLRRYHTTIGVALFFGGLILYLLSEYLGKSVAGQLLSALGTFLAGVIAVSFIYERFIREDFQRIFSDDTYELLEQLLDAKIGTHGVRYYRNRRAIDGFRNRVASAKQEVWILQTNLTAILELIEYLREAQENVPDLDIRVLVLNPQSEFLNARGHLWLDKEAAAFIDESRGSYRGFIQRVKKSGLKCEMRLYDELPAFIMFRIDDQIIIGFVTASAVGRQCSHIELPVTLPGVRETFVRHYDILWERSTVVNMQNLQPLVSKS